MNREYSERRKRDVTLDILRSNSDQIRSLEHKCKG